MWCGLAVLVGLVGVPAPQAGGDQDLAQIRARGVLRVITLREEQPELYRHDAAPDPGFYRELVEGFARLHRLRMETVAVGGFGDRIPALLEGRGDLVVGLIQTPERRELVDFSLEVLPAFHVVVNCGPARPIADLAEFRQQRVGLIPNSSWAAAAAEGGVPTSQAVHYPDTDRLIQALEAQQIEATVMSVSDFTLAQKRHPRLQGGVAVGPRTIDAWGLRKSDDDLEAAVNEYLSNVRKTPTWSRLVVKYFGEQALRVLKGGQ